MRTLKEQLKHYLDLPESNFDSHQSDLYVKYSPEVCNWLKENYQYWNNCKTFTSQIDKCKWLDIPFAYEEHFYEKHKNYIQRKSST